MAINKVVYGNDTLIDLTNDTVEANNLLEGETAHDRSGSPVTGTAKQGHIIKNSSGTAQTQRANMQFLDSYITDDPTNNCTKVENIKEVDPADYASTTDEGIIVSDDGKDALIGAVSDDYVEVTADGVKDFATLLNELADLVDTTKLSHNSTIIVGTHTYSNVRVNDSTNGFMFTYAGVAPNAVNTNIYTIILKQNGSHYLGASMNNSGTVVSNIDNNLQPNGTKFTLYYGNKKAVVDLQTTANRCLMADGETVQNRLTWKSLTVPTPTVDGNKRTYSFPNIRSFNEIAIDTFVSGYAQIDSRVVALREHNFLYVVGTTKDWAGYSWYGHVKYDYTNKTIVVVTEDSSYQPSNYPIVLNSIDVR